MSRAAPAPGVEDVIIDVLQDPITALTIARQLAREGCNTDNIQEAAIAVIAGHAPKEGQNEAVYPAQAD